MVRCKSKRGDDSHGFSLIEVLIALSIAGAALSAIAAVFGNGLIGLRTGSEASTALSIAESQIAMVGSAQPLRPGTHSGSFDDRYTWQVSVAQYDPPALTPVDAEEEITNRLYRVSVIVQWSDGVRRRRLDLSTLRLSAARP